MPTYTFDNVNYAYTEGVLASARIAYGGAASGNVILLSSFEVDGATYTVTSIDESAFSNCTGLTSITLPESVTRTGRSAFSDCTGLTSLTIPNSVTIIDQGAFSGCTGLTTLTIPNSVTNIDQGAFNNCTGLTTLTISNSVTTITNYAFTNCTGLTTLTIPNSVTSIDSYAFSGCIALTTLNIPNSVTTIDNSAFSGCIALTTLTIPNSVTNIGWRAFSGCTGLTTLTIPNSVTNIESDSFSGCTGLINVVVKSYQAAINIGYKLPKNTGLSVTFDYVGIIPQTNLTNVPSLSITLGPNITSIGNIAFNECTGLTSVTIPNSVTSIGESSFLNCTGLTSLTIPNSVTNISNYAFFGCTGLTTLTIPNSLTSIGEFTFSGCTGLTTVTLPESVTTIGLSAFSGCTGLATFAILTSVTSIASSAFSGCTGLTSVTIPSSVTTFGDSVFSDCSLLTNVVIKSYESAINIGNKLPNNTGLSVTFDYVGTIPQTNFANVPSLSITLGSSITEIGDSAFNNCTGLTTLTIPNSVTMIKYSALSGCTSLTSITIPNSVTSIGEEAFFNCTGLTSVTIPNSVTMISYRMFAGCAALTSITIPESVTTIDYNAFSGCSSLTTFTIPNSVTFLSNNVFPDCNLLTTFVINSSAVVDSIGDKLPNNTGLSITFDFVGSIPQTNLNVLPALGNVTLGPNITGIGNSAFSNCPGLTTLIIPGSVTSIGENAFNGCSGLTTVTIANSVTSIGNYAFNGCSGLTTLTIPNSVTSIDNYAFSGCTGLTSLTIPNSVTYIGEGALSSTGLTSVSIPNSVTGISYGLLSDCGSLTTVTIPNSVMWIDSNAFSYCTSLTSITIPNSVTSIGDQAFFNCSSLTTVTIPNLVTSIGNQAFSGCTGLTTVTIPASLTNIGENAFEGFTGQTILSTPSSETKAATVLTNFSVGTKTFGDAAFNIVAPTTNSNGVFTYTSSNTAVATVSGSTITIVGAGTSTITASQATNANYLAGTTTATLTVNKATTILTNFSVGTKTFGDAAFNIVAPTTNSNGVFTYTSSNTAVATVSGSTITIVGAGTSTITASQATNANYLAATTTATLTVNKATTILTNFSIDTKTVGGANFNIVAPTSNSNGGFTYTSSNTAVATVSGITITIVGVGTTTITASQAANANYLAATTTAILTVNSGSTVQNEGTQTTTMTYGPLSAITYGTTLMSRLTASIEPLVDGDTTYYINSVQVSGTTVLDASSHIITATFVPSLPNYIGSSVTTTLLVNKASTSVTYPVLQSVFFNAPIGVECLCATVAPAVSGTMSYFTNSTFTNEVLSSTTLAQGTYTLYARFTPTSPNYLVSSASTSLIVLGQTAPTISFPSVTSVEAYLTLESILNGISAGVAGTFIFNKNSIAGAILTASSTFDVLGPFSIFCRFSPTDTVRYMASTATLTLNVKCSPTFLFNQRPLSTVSYGANLSESALLTTVGQFNNTTIPGTVSFSNGITTSSFLTPGIYTVVATFTPTNLNIYNIVTTSKQILVSKQPLTVNITSPSVKAAFINSAPIDCSYQVMGILTTLGDTFNNSVTGTIVNKYFTFDGVTELTSSYVYNTTFPGSSQTYKIVTDISGFSSTKYDFTPQTYTFTINKYTPTITYTISTPNKTLPYSVKLGANQLNAIVSYNGTPITSGSIVYTQSTVNTQLTVDSNTVLSIGQHNLYAYFSDASNNVYNSVNTSMVSTNVVTVSKATPVVSFPAITTLLSGSSLNNILRFVTATFDSSNVDGTFVFSYVNQSGATVVVNSTTVITRPPSTITINGSFTPTNSTLYNNSSGSITLTVSELNSTLTATPLLPAPFTYGKSFSQLYGVKVTPSIGGTYAYYNAAKVSNPVNLLDAGTYTYSVIFNPTSSSYVSSVVDVSFTIQKANMTISYVKQPSYAYQTANQLSLLQPTKSVAVDGELKIFLNSSFTNELTNATPMAIGTHTLYVRFTPLKNFNVVTTTTTLTVTKIPCILSYTTKSSSITYGAAFAPFLNNSVAGSIAGSMQYYYDASFTQIVNSLNKLNFGTHTIYNRFVPTNSSYATAYATNTIKVSKAVLSIKYPKLSSIEYGTTLQSSFTASAVFDGSMNYFISGTQKFANTILNAGDHTIVATFTPRTPSNFTTTSVSVSQKLTVTKRSPTITFIPSNITRGTAFGPSMTATVSPNIPGTMRYFRNNIEILSSTVLNSGNYTIVITFTPTESANYKTSSISSALTVITTQQLAIVNENKQQIQNATNNQTVSIVCQNTLLPPTLDLKVKTMSAGQTSITAPTTNAAVTGLQFDFGNGAVGTNVKVAVSTLTVNLPNAANTPAIFFKFYDESGNSIVSASNPVTLTLKLPKYKGKTKNIFLARLQDVGTLVDGTKIPLTSKNPTNPQNIDFTAVFTSNSIYVATEEESTGSVTDALTSNMYAFEATGGFVMQRGFDDIKARDLVTVETFDVTDSVQILFDVALFNAKLGLNKNEDNNEILSSLFNPVTDQFELDGSPINTLSFTASEFIDGVIKSEQIISVGKYSTVYSDFRNYVATYFGFDGGFSSLFTAASEFAIDDDNHFDSESMMQLFAGVPSTGSSAYINQMTGSISISDVTSSLRYSIDTNCFGNRTPIADPSQNATGSAVNPDDKNNYGVEDGFLAGDLIWIPTGTTFNLGVNIDVESFMPLNNVGPQNISSLQNTNFTSGNFSQDTTATTTNIHRTVRAPLLIKLVNGSTINSL